MMRVETSVTGFTVWLIISAGTSAACSPAAMWRSAVSTNSVACSSATGTSNRQASAENSGCLPMMRSPCSNRSGCSTAPPVMSSGLFGVPKLGSAARSSAAAVSDSAGIGTSSTCARSATISHAPPEIDTTPNPRGSQHAGARDHVGGEQQVLDRVHAHDAKLAADAVEHAVVADQRAGVRLRRTRGDLGQADLQHHDRLGRRDRPPRRRGEAWRMADRLGEQRDRAHLGLIDQMVDEVGAVEIGLVAGRHHVRQADLVLRRQAGDEAAVGAALRHHRDRTGLARCAEAAGPQRHVVDEVDQAQAVRSEQRYVVLPRQRGEARLVIGALVAGLGKARSENHRIVHIGGGEIGQRLVDRRPSAPSAARDRSAHRPRHRTSRRLRPCTVPPRRLTRYTSPGYFRLIRLSNVFCDQRERSVAPTSAIERGRSMAVRSRRAEVMTFLPERLSLRGAKRRSNLGQRLCAHNSIEIASSLRSSQ